MAALPIIIDPGSLPDLQHRSETLFDPPGSIAPITEWLHCGDHRLALLRRSWSGAIAAIIRWLDYGDPQMAL
jgi:hypothetical protein